MQFHKALMVNLKPGRPYRNVLFSGRFDPPHLGHWCTILSLLSYADKVTVVVLDYEGRRYAAQYAAQAFAETAKLSVLSSKIIVEINTTHFAKITYDEFSMYHCDSYATGNMEVFNHIAALGIPCIYVPRSLDYEAHCYVPDWAKTNNKGQSITTG